VSGIFITFEGPDGSGKSTQLSLLAEALRDQGQPVLVTREPGGTPISDQIRRIILDPQNEDLTAKTEALLYAASRAQHVEEKIVPALQAGQIVLCDRFVDASLAYQGYGLGVGVDKVKQLNAFATDGLVPHRTFLLDISAEKGRSRLEGRTEGEFNSHLDRIEQRELSYHHQVREAFRHLAVEEERIVYLEGGLAAETLHERILNNVQQMLKQRR
jgi:dTMP kinase